MAEGKRHALSDFGGPSAARTDAEGRRLTELDIEKQVADRVQIVLDDPHLLKVHQRFGGEVFRRSSVFHGLGRFLREHKIKGDTCFEIGTWNGLTAVVLSRHFKQVVSVDIVGNAVKRDIVSYLEIGNIQFLFAFDNAHKAELAAGLNFDFAYLDGNHADDTRSDFDLVKHCGRVLFHEVREFQQPVWRLVHSLPPDQVQFGGAGLALWTAS